MTVTVLKAFVKTAIANTAIADMSRADRYPARLAAPDERRGLTDLAREQVEAPPMALADRAWPPWYSQVGAACRLQAQAV